MENLAVLFAQIGEAFGGAERVVKSPEQRLALQEALAAYVTPDLVNAINEARIRLGSYVPDEEAEALSEQIVYWDDATPP